MVDATIYISGWEVEGLSRLDNLLKNMKEFMPIPGPESYAEAAPCEICMKMIKNARIKDIVWRRKDGTIAKKSLAPVLRKTKASTRKSKRKS
jgi:deoxycytidylate deaminase